ncbi:MAG: hypothetical protein K0R58_2767 [Ramlibacter sp.]|jgi:hypothetical protein|nr:hypothetical protein [Ramlibacter sp.]
MIRLTLTAVALALSGAALAKLPALDDAAKAKAAETAARQAWQAKLDAYQLCNVQDRIAAQYKKTGAVQPAAAPPAGMTPTAASATAPAAGKTAAPSQGSGTPVTNVGAAPTTLPTCANPGPFAYNPPAQTPLETSGAHSPAGNAAAPPSVRPESAQMAPAGAATQQSKKP